MANLLKHPGSCWPLPGDPDTWGDLGSWGISWKMQLNREKTSSGNWLWSQFNRLNTIESGNVKMFHLNTRHSWLLFRVLFPQKIKIKKNVCVFKMKPNRNYINFSSDTWFHLSLISFQGNFFRTQTTENLNSVQHTVTELHRYNTRPLLPKLTNHLILLTPLAAFCKQLWEEEEVCCCCCLYRCGSLAHLGSSARTRRTWDQIWGTCEPNNTGADLCEPLQTLSEST